MPMNPKWSTRFQLKPGKWVFVPTPDMVRIGKEIKTAVEARWRAPSYFYHLRAGGHVAALKVHLGNTAFLRLDLHDFFGSIGRSRVIRILKSRFSHATAREWAHASTVRDASGISRSIVPFGFVQSPIVASWCLDESALGRQLGRLHRGRRVKISVYVDDIILSSEDESGLGDELIAGLEYAARRSRFAFSAEKTQGPAPTIKAFNIELCRQAMRIEERRMSEFVEALKQSESTFQRAGILGYIGSVNADQGADAARVAPARYC